MSTTWQPMERVPGAGPETWASDLYHAQVHRDADSAVLCLSVRRLDGLPVHDWRHLQAVKNDIAGTDAEAIELLPRRVPAGGHVQHVLALGVPAGNQAAVRL